MELFKRIKGAFASLRNAKPDYGLWSSAGSTFLSYPSESSSGEKVTVNSSLTSSAVFAAVNILSNTIAQLPLHIYKKTDEGVVRADSHPLCHILEKNPNRWMTSFEMRRMMQTHLCLRGNAYAQVIRDIKTSQVSEIIPIHPDSISIYIEQDKAKSNFGKKYYYTGDPLTQGSNYRVFESEEIIHIKGMSFDGIRGVSPITYAKESIGLSIAADKHMGVFFKRGGRPSGVITFEDALTREQKNNLRDSLTRQQDGGAFGALVLDQGMKWDQIGMSNDDAQFIDAKKATVEDISRWFNVPVHMLGDLSSANFSNLEARSIEFVKYSILPIITNWEQALDKTLVFSQNRKSHEILFDVEALERGDSKSRSQAAKDMFNIGVSSINDILRSQGKNTIGKKGDERFVNGNVVPLSKVEELTMARIEKGSQPQEQEPEKGGVGDDARSLQKMLRENLVSEFSRLATKEGKALARAAGKENFEEKINEFYENHKIHMRENLALPVEILLTQRGEEFIKSKLDSFVDDYIADSFKSLRDFSKLEGRNWTEARTPEIFKLIGEVENEA